VFDVTNSSLSTEAVDLLACEVLADLYRAYCGAPALGVRAYRDADALLLLLRFEPGSIEPDEEGDLDPLISAALRSMPGLIASAVEARAGVRLAPGNLSACSARGLAVFAFSVLEDDAEQPIDDDIFGFDASFAPQRASRPPLRLVS
jgi:hypothetical protein